MDEEKLLRDLCRAPAEGEDDWQQKLAAAQGAKRLAWDLPATPAQGRKIFVEPLSVLMSHHSGSVAVTAASALGALADGDPSVQQALSSARALQELVRLLRNDLVPGLSWRVASIIGRLAAQVEDMDTKLMQADGFKALEEQLDVQDAHSQAKAAAVLGILAQSEVGRQRIISFRRAPRLVHMSWSQDSSVRLAAVRLLALLAIDDEETRLCAGSDEGDHNGIHLLVGNGQRGSEQDAAAGDLADGSVRVNEEALSDFSNIKFHGIIARGIGEIALRAAQLLARILDGGRSGVFNHHALEVALAARGEDALVRMLKDGEVANAIAAAEVLGLMARESTDAQQAIAAAGGTHALVALSRPTPEADVDPNTDTTQRYAALEALNSVATESADIRTRIVKEGGAETAVLAAEVKELQLPALRLLALLAKDDFSVREIVRHEGINGVGIVLRSILNHTDAIGKELQRESCAEDGTNFTISEDTYLRPRGILEAAASAVARLAERDQTGSIQGIMLHDGLVESLCALAQLDASLLPTQTQLPVLAALAAVADGNARTQARIVKYDGLVHIVHAAVSTQEAVQSRAALALLAFHHATEHVQRALIRTILAEFEHADEYGRHKLVVLIDKLASAGTFSTVAVSGGKAQFKRAARQVIQRVRVQRNLQAAREEAARAAAELAAGPPLGVSIKPNAIVGVTIMKGVFAPDADGRWGEILADPDYAGDTKLRYIDDGTESDYIKQHDLGKAVRSRDDLIENWPPEPEPVPAPGPEYMDMLKRESAKGESLQTVIEWLAGAPYDFVFAVKALDGLCAGPLHIKEEIGSSPSTAIMIQCSAKILSDAIQACKVEDHAEHHNIWDDKANHMRGDEEEEVQRAEHAVFKTIWSAMRHRRKLFGHELADIKATFDAVNSDNSGWVSLQEFQVAMKRLDLGLSDEQLQVVFDASDKSHDGKLQYAEFAEELHLRHATPLQTYAHRVACLLRLLTTQGMGRLVQSAGIAAIVCLAEDPKTCNILVQLGAMDILVDMQKSGDVTPYWSDISCGNIASHARIALSSLLAHMRTPDTVFSITSGLLALVTSNKQLFTGKDKAAHRVFRAAGWTNALIAIDSLELLKAGNVGEKEAVDVLAGVNLPGERPHKKKGTRLPNERTDERTDQAGRAAGAIGLMLNVIKRLTGNDKHKRDFGPDPVPNKGATATQCVAAVLGILAALMGHGQEAATRDLIAYQGDVIFFNKLVEMIPALQEPCTPILIIVREYDILRKTAEKMRDRELAEAAIRIQTNFREWKAKRLEAEAKRKAELEAKRKRRKEAQQKIKGKGKGKGTGKGKGKGKPALRASGSVNASSTSTTKSLVGHRLRSSKSKGSELSDKELARRRLKAYNEQQDKKRRQDREAMLEKKKAKEEQRQQRMLEEMGKAPPSASVGAWSTDLPDVPLKPTSTRGSARRHTPKNSPMRINVPDESPTNNRYDCVVDTPTTPAAAESIEAAELAVALNAPMMPEPEREPESSSSLPPVLKTNSIDLDDMKRFDTDLNAILAEHTISQAEMTACEAAFMKADRNGDGAIQQSEFRHLLSELGIGVSLQQLRAYSDSFFSKQDKDGSGAVDLDEFQKFYHRCLASEKIRRKYIEHVQHRLSNDHMSEAVRKERALSAFLAYDADQSNVIEKKELSSILRDLLPIKLSSSQWRLLINELLARGDKDHSGGLDFDEFFDLYSKCLASSMVTEHFSDKVVMRFDKGGQWYLEAVADEGATTDQKEAALARFIAEEQKPTKAANASHESAAAAHIQARQRGKLARQKQQMQHDAAVTLQKVVRGRQTRGQRLGMLVPLDGDPPKELVEVFNKLDTDDDGYLKHADIVRLDKICGRPVVLDYAGWLSLCEMVSCRNPKAGLTLNDMWQYYAQAGDDELMQARSALFAQDTKEQTRSVTQIQAAVRGKRGRKQAAERKSEAIQERAAATKIQAHHRGKTGRKSAEQKKEKESSAATKVQAMQRGRATRRTIATKQADEIRAMDERAKQFAEEAEQKRQAAGQPDTTDSAALAEQKKQADAAAKIQSRARGKQTRKTLHERRKAAIALQSRQRGRAARSKYAGRHKATTEQREEQGQKQQPATTPPETEPAPPKPVHPEPPPAPANPDAKDMVAAIFAHYDTDQDGWLQHADVSRLEKETGDGGAVDPDSWAGLCEILGADKKKGLSLANLTRFYAMEEEAVASAEGSKTPRGAGHLTPRNQSELSKTYFALFPAGQHEPPIALDTAAADDE